MLTLSAHNAARLAHLKLRNEVEAGVECDECRAPMVVADVCQSVVGDAPGVAVKCPRCGHRGALVL